MKQLQQWGSNEDKDLYKDVEHDEVGLGVVKDGLDHGAVVLVGRAVELLGQLPLVVGAEAGEGSLRPLNSLSLEMGLVHLNISKWRVRYLYGR